MKQEYSVESSVDSPLLQGGAAIHIAETDLSNMIHTSSSGTNDAAETQKQNKENQAQNKLTHEEMQNQDLMELSSIGSTPELVTSTIDNSNHSTAGTGIGIGTNNSSTSSGSPSKRRKVDVNEVDDADAKSDEQFGQEDEVSIPQDREGGNDHSPIHGPKAFQKYLAELVSFLLLASTTPVSTSNEEKQTRAEEMLSANVHFVEPSSIAGSPEFDSKTIHNTYQAAAGIVTHDYAGITINDKEVHDDAKSDEQCRHLLIDEVIAQEREDENDHSSSRDHGNLEAINTFQERFKELTFFKAQHGHCHPPKSLPRVNGNYPFGMWCVNLKRSYKHIQENKVPCFQLISQLETLGFVWDIERAFEVKFAELSAFKSMHGHCNPPRNPSTAYFSIGQWYYDLRKAYEQIQRGQTPQWPLSKDQIRRLEILGFKWKLINRNAFEERFVELTLFLAKYGHCSPPQTSATPYYSLAIWCNDARRTYKQLQQGKHLRRSKVTQDQIVRLEKLGFEWTRSSKTYQIIEDDHSRLKRRSFLANQSFEERIADLILFKHKFGHFYSTETSTRYYSLARWCNQKRRAYAHIQQGKTPHNPLSQDQVRVLESLEFPWGRPSARANIVQNLPVTPDRFLQKAMAVINHRSVIVPSTAVPDCRNIYKFNEKVEAPLEVILPPIPPDSIKNRSMRKLCPVCYVWNGSCCKSTVEIKKNKFTKQIN